VVGNHAADQIWRTLDPVLWQLTQNPWVVLQTVSRDQLERVLANPAFRKVIDELLHAKGQASERPAWFQQAHPRAQLTCVVYFSMEFMLSEAPPIYSAGLGNVAGDQLKAASRVSVRVIRTDEESATAKSAYAVLGLGKLRELKA
jgi:glycogen phosphorylase